MSTVIDEIDELLVPSEGIDKDLRINKLITERKGEIYDRSCWLSKETSRAMMREAARRALRAVQ